MLLFPKNLGLLAGIAGDQTRYSMAGIRVMEFQDGFYRLEVTDGKMLGIIRGPSSATPREVEMIQTQLVGAPNGAIAGIIPAEFWAKMFKLVQKRGHLGLVLGENQATFGTVDTKAETPLLEGRFPNVDLVLPRTPPLIRFVVNPDLLTQLLALAGAVCSAGERDPSRRVEFLFYKPGAPIGLMSRNDQGQTLDALLMPLT